MLRVSCTHCHMPFILNRDMLQAALEEVHSEGYKHYNTYCPNCGRPNKVSRRQLQQAAPWWRAPAKKAAAPAKKAPAAQRAPAKQPAPTKAKAAPAKKAAASKGEAPSTRKKLSSFEFGARTLSALEDAGVTTVAAALKKLDEGKEAVLDINGIGPAGLDEIKKVLKKAGYTIPK